jgi:predicted Rossmann fold flavoprotein
MIYDLIVVGGGAAGFFAAIQAAELQTAATILIVEKSPKLLSKVRVSGGGRCNVTHNCFDPKRLAGHYPRGEKVLKEIFKTYHGKSVVDWFATKGVKLKTEADGRMFPDTDDSETIINCFMREAHRHNITIEINNGVNKVLFANSCFEVTSSTGAKYLSKQLLIATGGNPNRQAYDWIADLGHNILQPVPSLFTFNDSEKKFVDLMGVAVSSAEVRIAGTKHVNSGPVLITHWGLSGPGVIRLSAWAAEYLRSVNYEFTALVNWTGSVNEETLKDFLVNHKKTRGKQKVVGNPLYSLPQRLWSRLCALAEINEEKIWAELPQKNINRLMEFMIRCPFKIKGKTTFKDEFVTCGGVDLKEIDLSRMESKNVKGLFFAGEVLNIDGETGGFNFQAAWSTAYVAAMNLNPQLARESAGRG